jgi:hypothetical protein
MVAARWASTRPVLPNVAQVASAPSTAPPSWAAR